MDSSTAVTLVALLLALVAGLAVGYLLASARAGSRQTRDPVADRLALESRAAEHARVRHGLDLLHEQMRELQEQRVSWQAQLAQQVADVRHSTDLLRHETRSLSTALRRPQVRGRWGELHLRRAVELAGLVARCDFEEQVTLHGSAGSGAPALRPDLVVHLAGGRQVVVDAKVPLDAFLDATGTEDAAEQDAHLGRHARQLRQHVDSLSAKSYWRALPGAPEFVVLFVPGESFLSAALEKEPTLIEYAAERRVVLATPTTLIALLRTVALGWTQQSLTDKARDIHRLGRELHERLGVLGGHLDRMGRALGSAVAAYNQAVGSLESRVLVSARRFRDLDVTDEDLTTPEPLEVAPRRPSAVELVDDARSGVSAGPAARRSAGEADGVSDVDSA